MKHHRKFNFIFFIDQGPTRTWTIDSRYFFAGVAGVAFVIATLISLISLSWMQSGEISDLKSVLTENKERLFAYKVRVDDIYTKYYAQLSPSKFNKIAQQGASNPLLAENKAGDLLATSGIELPDSRHQSTSESEKSEESARVEHSPNSEQKYVEFEGVKVLATSETLQAKFLIKNLTPGRLEGRFTIVSEFIDDSGKSHFVAHPDRTSLSAAGIPIQLENGTLFNIQRFKPTAVSVDKPKGLGGKFVRATLYALAKGSVVKDEVSIEASVSNAISNLGVDRAVPR